MRKRGKLSYWRSRSSTSLEAKPVRNLADRRLEIANGKPGQRPDQAVGLADSKAAARQKLLHLVALVEREHALVARPGLHERRAAAHAVGKMADGKRIGFGGIVFHDDAEIFQHQESRAPRAGRQQQKRAILGTRKGPGRRRAPPPSSAIAARSSARELSANR